MDWQYGQQETRIYGAVQRTWVTTSGRPAFTNCATLFLASSSDMSPLSGLPTDSSKQPSPPDNPFAFSAAASSPLRRNPSSIT